jgi:uncharacterized protein
MFLGYLNFGLSIESFLRDLLNRYESSYTKRVVIESIDLLNQLWPYVVGGILFSTIVKLYISKKWFVTFFQKYPNGGLVLSSFLGVISPLGSYVVMPLAASLTASGVPIHILMAFLVSSPLINPSLFMITAGAFGFEMAIARVLSAFVIGLAAGYVTKWLMYKKFIVESNLVKPGYKIRDLDLVPDEKNTLYTFATELFRFAVFISKFFFLSVILAAIIKISVSPKLVSQIFSDNNFLSVLITTGAGVPFYVCGGAAIPVVQQLAELGLSKGAVLAYFISGPITKVSNLVMMNAVYNFKLFLVYLLTAMMGAVILGTLYNYL